MDRKTVLLIDDEPSLLEPLADALENEGVHVIRVRTAEDGINVLKNTRIDLVTIDIMIDPGEGLRNEVKPHEAGIYVCEYVARHHGNLNAFCLSVASDANTIKKVQSLGIKFLRKGETPLRTVLDMIRSRLTGIAYSTERPQKWWKKL